ncbi:hypothetical protein DP125_13610 [Clostridium tetani]|uniref:hypothetical protein n=1 Tax=Clostridium phage phiCT19406C TaxID=1567011 RepID=UPI00054ED95C|nr:hypothetical protein [Clostridium tetani]YP_009218064.1 hypothetical protein phiCT19406C_35 [Clostridium phage phiCT19406C]AJA42858.1 hypothetical protein phiCT19406C_35 [Clostridium phage phiCT19406C]KHO30851.1 hypothetical protein OR63_13385 [Clostridium tetani]RXI57489.1 hypothetical protein DP125_13610 [Clostridium tetani]RXI62331.1 hypothetical protein DP132_06640 [Clostridium tetani]RXI69574.1 hypothetical protein DP121_08950 [Clostridium tetani]
MDIIGKIIKQFIITIFTFIIKDIEDILILGGCGVLTTAFFIYVSEFAGMICLSIILIILGLILSRIQK